MGIYTTTDSGMVNFTPDQAASSFFSLGLGYIKNHQYREAIVCFDEALSLESKAQKVFPHIHAAKGEALRESGQNKEAIICFDMALKHMNDNEYKKSFIYASKAKSLTKLERHYEAIECYGKAIKLSPNSQGFAKDMAEAVLIMRRSQNLDLSFLASSSEPEPENLLALDTKDEYNFDNNNMMHIFLFNYYG